ncbi:N-acetyltransferase family protein [Streptomyces sp. SudanB182_2057]|uniref:GNAT family N-acetyltransferase n=1 Tax=Streptomyces sp. SudanB182_2057 TaxID=3035281 RepID=UPI003F55F02C
METFETSAPGEPAIRPLRPEDEAGVARLLAACEDYFVAATGSAALPADVQSLYYSLPEGADFDQKHLLVLWHEDTPVGLVDAVRGHPDPATCSVGLFLIDPRVRGAGLGTRAARRLLRAAEARGTGRVTATCPPDWAPGVAFLRRLGFELHGAEPQQSPTVGNRLRRPAETRLCTAVLRLGADAGGAPAPGDQAGGGAS